MLVLDVDALEHAAALVRGVLGGAEAAWDGAPEEVVVRALQAAADVARAVDGLKVASAGAVERRSTPYTRSEALASRLGQSSPKGLLTEVFGVGFYQAQTWLELAGAAREARRWPALRQALVGGELSIETAKVIHEHLAGLKTESIPGGIGAAEATLVANATAGRVNLFEQWRRERERDAALAAQRAARQDAHQQGIGGAGDAPGAAGLWGAGARGAPKEPGSGVVQPGPGAGGPWEAGADDTDGASPTEGAAERQGEGVGVGYVPIATPRFLPQGSSEGDSGASGGPGWFGAGAGPGSGAGFGPGAEAVPAVGSAVHEPRQAPDAGGPAGFGWFRPGQRPGIADRRGGFVGGGLAAAGGRLSPKNVLREAKDWAAVLDPQALERAHEEQHRRRFFDLKHLAEGGYAISGFAPELEGAAMRTLLDAHLSPRTADPAQTTLFGEPADDANTPGADQRAHGAARGSAASGSIVGAGAAAASGRSGGGSVPSADARTHRQKTFDVLAQMVRDQAASAAAPRIGGAAPTLLITASLEALDAHLRSCAEHHDDSPVPTFEGQAVGGPAPGGPDVGSPAGRGSSAGSPVAGVGRMLAGNGPCWPRSLAEIPLDSNGLPDGERLADLRFARIGRDGTPVPIRSIAHLLCDAAIQLLLTDNRGAPLRLGREQRLFSKDQRRVLVARDRHCRAPGCDIPATWCEAHHVVPWSGGGYTDVGNAILLCSFHHHEIDRGRLRVEHLGGGDAPSGQGVITPYRVVAAAGGAAREPLCG